MKVELANQRVLRDDTHSIVVLFHFIFMLINLIIFYFVTLRLCELTSERREVLTVPVTTLIYNREYNSNHFLFKRDLFD